MKITGLNIFIATSLLLLTSCKHKDEPSFSSFASSLPELRTPFTIWCGLNGPFPEQDKFKSEELMCYAPSGYQIAGKFPSRHSITPVMYFVMGDMVCPYLFTYNSSGNIIDSLYLHTGECYGELGEWRNAFSIIDTDMNITMIDTMGTYLYDLGKEKKIKGSDSAFVFMRCYSLTNTGHFQKTRDEKTYIGQIIKE